MKSKESLSRLWPTEIIKSDEKFMKNIISLASSSNEKSSIGAILLLDSFPTSSFEHFSLSEEEMKASSTFVGNGQDNMMSRS